MDKISKQIRRIEQSDQSADYKISLLRCQRCKLLDKIHLEQQLLDKIDYLIIQIKNEHK